MNLNSNEKNISTEKFDEIIKNISPYKSMPKRIGNSCISGSGFKSFTFTDGERDLRVGYIPKESGSIVDMDNPKLTESHAVVVYEDNARIIQSDEIKNIPYFPKLRQSFHEDEDYRCRDADYKYHFEDGETLIAANSPNPIPRQEDLKIVAIEYLGGSVPQSWILQTEENGYLYLRERSGSIRMMDGLDSEAELIYHAFIGAEHPGTYIKPHEVLKIISSMDYIDIVENYDSEVPEEAHEKYWGDYLDNDIKDEILEL